MNIESISQKELCDILCFRVLVAKIPQPQNHQNTKRGIKTCWFEDRSRKSEERNEELTIPKSSQQENDAFSIVFSKKRQRQGFRSFENQGVYSCK
jgi:hypothetical protein